MIRRIFQSVCAVLTVCLIISASALRGVCAAEPAAEFTAEEQEFISSHKTLKVGYVADRIPVCFDNNGEPDGVSLYIFERVSELCGMDFEYEALPAGQVTYDYLQSRHFDLVTSVEYNEENKKANGILITEPYLSCRKVIVARDDTEFKQGEVYSLAVSTGSQTLKKVLARMFPNFEIKDYSSITECFDAVKNRDSDFLIQNQYVVEYWLSKPKYENLGAIPIMGLDDKLCFSAVVAYNGGDGLSNEDGATLVDILDKAIAGISEDETSNYIISGVTDNQYNDTFADFIYRYRTFVVIFIVGIAVIIAMTILLLRLHIRVTENRADAKAKGRFLSTMSHEIRTPLNGLIGLNYLMTQNSDDKEKMQSYLRQSLVTAKYLLSLVNDILDSSNLEEQKLKLVPRPINLSLMLDTINAIVTGEMKEKKMRYYTEISVPYPNIIGDEVRIQQVILNLLDNARKFTNSGGMVTLSVTQEKNSDEKILTTVTVSDTGKGMSEEFQKHVFDLFAQDLDMVSKGNQGTGLGLFISRRLALLMDGDLVCESEKNIGSKFTFTFVSEIFDAENKAPAEPIGDKRPRILVAEDNELNGEIILELLHSSGFDADIADNGKKALEMYENSAPYTYGIILMDLLMPEMDGFEAAEAIRALPREDARTVKIYACTANSFAEEQDKAFACGMDDFITKPVDIEVLLDKLSR